MWPHHADHTPQFWPVMLRRMAVSPQIVIADGAVLASQQWARWAAVVRAVGRTAAIALAPTALSPTQLRLLEGCGPLLVVLRGNPATSPEDLQRAVALLSRSRCPTLRWSHLSVPLCWLGDAQADVALMQQRGPVAPSCSGCALQGVCGGPLGDGQAVSPLPQAVSNQFDLVLGGDGVHCVPIAGDGGVAQAAVVGQVDGAVVEQALRRGQLYLDRSHVARLDDFAAQLALLAPPAVPGAPWQVHAIQPFAVEEERLVGLMERLLLERGGCVVDVGAGPLRYTSALRPALVQGRLQYVAVEPDLHHLAHSRAALPEGHFVRGVGEALPLADGCADVVMWLRSWNHLRDPVAAVREAARVLRPGGWLLAVDNVAFGLVRTAAQLQRAHAIAVTETPFEHYRNDDAAACVATLQAVLGASLRCEAIDDVGAGTSNQWLVLMQYGGAALRPDADADADAGR